MVLNNTYDLTSFASRASRRRTLKDKIETKLNHNLIGNLARLKMEKAKSSDCLAATKLGTLSLGWQYASEVRDAKTGELRFNGYVVTRSHPGQPEDLARETDWSKPDRRKIDGTYVKPQKFLAWVATSAARGRLEVLFITQKGLREQLTEILQEVEDYTWTDQRDLLTSQLKLHVKVLA